MLDIYIYIYICIMRALYCICAKRCNCTVYVVQRVMGFRVMDPSPSKASLQ